MLLLFWMMLVVAGSCLLLLVPLFWASQVYAQLCGTRVVTCPETHQEVAITFHALRAAITGLDRRPVARIADCSRWSPLPVRCRQQCVPQALRAAPCGYGEVDPQRTKVIYHLPVLIAAFAAWCAGAICTRNTCCVRAGSTRWDSAGRSCVKSCGGERPTWRQPPLASCSLTGLPGCCSRGGSGKARGRA